MPRQRSAQAAGERAQRDQQENDARDGDRASRVSTAHLVDHQGGQGCHPHWVGEALGEHQEHQRPRGTQAVEPVTEPEAPECGRVRCRERHPAIGCRQAARLRRLRGANCCAPASARTPAEMSHGRSASHGVASTTWWRTSSPKKARRPNTDHTAAKAPRNPARSAARRSCRRPFGCHLDRLDREEARGHHHRRALLVLGA